ncbi:hypothetical protein PG993_011558 [Apiospora rasikravindrae]|uniref:Uncharacterized protein n=1 Tax=Apiospora rasikravindrae TaxID=990691 RepID=A0ABR1RZZ0_9PEZI
MERQHYFDHVNQVEAFLELVDKPHDGELHPKNVDSVFQHHVLIHSLSLANLGRIMTPHYKDKSVNYAIGSRNETKAPRDGLKDTLPLLDPIYILSRMVFAVEQAPDAVLPREGQSMEYLIVNKWNAMIKKGDDTSYAYNVRRLLYAVQTFQRIEEIIKQHERDVPRLSGSGRQRDKRKNRAIRMFMAEDTAKGNDNSQKAKWKNIRGMGEALNVLVEYGRGIIAVFPLFEMHKAMDGGELVGGMSITLMLSVRDLLVVLPVTVTSLQSASERAGVSMLKLLVMSTMQADERHRHRDNVRTTVQTLAQHGSVWPQTKSSSSKCAPKKTSICSSPTASMPTACVCPWDMVQHLELLESNGKTSMLTSWTVLHQVGSSWRTLSMPALLTTTCSSNEVWSAATSVPTPIWNRSYFYPARLCQRQRQKPQRTALGVGGHPPHWKPFCVHCCSIRGHQKGTYEGTPGHLQVRVEAVRDKFRTWFDLVEMDFEDANFYDILA